ncbi:hypothetical protein [Saccharothrix obliqua]|uniref:hypothetical protein n=1 Tax=Saccharothrix obliqua TaxID=2861747 RepID=UPI001C5DA1DB|nr:hypothetical protein [Saccharothrix obliqua]MBW4722097.1 hypothetical protein [Saccharothrix obliqua]
MAATAALAITLTASGSVSAADTRQDPQPPAVGTEFTWKFDAPGTELTVRDQKAAVDLTGEIGLRVEGKNSTTDPWDLKLKITKFGLTGEHHTERQGLGDISIALSDVDSTPDSTLKSESQVPLKLEQVLILKLNLSIQTPPDKLAEPLVLTTKDPARLVGKLTQFPPKDQAHQLEQPIKLTEKGSNDVVATIDKLPAKVGGN